MEFTNIWQNAAVSQRCVLVHGQCPVDGEGSVVIYYKDETFPALRFPFGGRRFKALVPLQEGDNTVKFELDVPNAEKLSSELQVRYIPPPENPPLHFCLLVAKDSPYTFQTMPYKQEREGNDLGTAVKKMRMASYMMSAFTQEQMNRNGCGFRSFHPYAEKEEDTLSNRDNNPALTTHIHVVKVDKTKAEINDPNRAQQNHDAKDAGALFGFAFDALKAYGGPFATDEFVQAACIYLDTNYDAKLDLIEGHAALGGSIGNFRLAIFGGHGLWSWPTCIEDLPLACLDDTVTDKRYVGNDTGELGSAWEAMSVSMGAFQHEVGHLLGCPHEPEGIMLCGYSFFERAFTALEGYSNCNKRVVCRYPDVKDEPFWYRADIVRFLNHPSFSLPGDKNRFVINAAKPLVFPVENGFSAQCPQGIYMIDLQVGEFSRKVLEYDLPTEVQLSIQDVQDALPQEWRNKPVHVHVHAKPMEQVDIDDLEAFAKTAKDSGIIYSKSLGNEGGEPVFATLPENKRVTMVRLHSGGGLDGIEFFFKDHDPVLLGKRNGQPHDVEIADDNEFLGISVRTGAWVDAGGVLTKNFASPMFGGSGGSLVNLLPPHGYRFAGLRGWSSNWMDGIAIGYCK